MIGVEVKNPRCSNATNRFDRLIGNTVDQACFQDDTIPLSFASFFCRIEWRTKKERILAQRRGDAAGQFQETNLSLRSLRLFAMPIFLTEI